MNTLHPNHAFCIDTAAELARDGRILDYGCGAGETVIAGLDRRLDIYGTDVFYDGWPEFHRRANARGLLEAGRVVAMKPDHIPFPDGHFDFVFHNQVFEHVSRLDITLSELRRVLRPNGTMLSVFPTWEALREGHCGVPLSHRFRKGSRIRKAYMLLWRSFGGGLDHEGRSPSRWTADFGHFLDDYCFYRRLPELIASYERAGFTFEGQEPMFAEYRLRRTRFRHLAMLTHAIPAVTQIAIRKLAGVVVVSRTKGTAS